MYRPAQSTRLVTGIPCASPQVLFAYELQRRLGPLGVQVRPKPQRAWVGSSLCQVASPANRQDGSDTV